MAKRKKREVVEMMFTGADRAPLVTEKMKKLYEGGRSGEQEGQREAASPEAHAADNVQEEIERTPQNSVHAVRQVSRTAERIKRVKETKKKAGRVPTARAAGTSQTVQAGEKATVAGTRKSTAKAAGKMKKLAKNAAKTVYQGIKSGGTLLAAGGGVALLVILLTCMVGMILGSTFGIFFTGSQNGNGSERTICTVMQELDAEYDQQILAIQDANEYDILEMHGARPEWKEVLAVYAVKTNFDPNDAEELITMTTKKEKKLRDIYWDMVQISSKVENEIRIVTMTVIGKDGKPKEKKVLKEVTVLTIRTDSARAEEMAGRYFFDWEQKELLKDLLDAGNDPLWAGVIP